MTRARFRWDDPLLLDAQLVLLDAQLGEDERMLRDAARNYCQDRLMPRVTEDFRDERSDPAIFREMGALACSGRPSRPGTAAPDSTTSPTT